MLTASKPMTTPKRIRTPVFLLESPAIPGISLMDQQSGEQTLHYRGKGAKGPNEVAGRWWVDTRGCRFNGLQEQFCSACNGTPALPRAANGQLTPLGALMASLPGRGWRMQRESQRVGPVNLSERIVFIDVLRGMALFGILAANMRAFFAPLDCYGYIGVLFHSRADVLAQVFIDAFIQGKFISIFSFLFGMGFAIQLSRAEARGARFLSFYPRRLLALALFGLIHGLLIWAGDILLTYAISGAILLLFRKRQQRTLLWWAGSLFALPIVASTVFLTLYFSRFHRPWMDPKPPDVQKLYAVIHIYAHGTV